MQHIQTRHLLGTLLAIGIAVWSFSLIVLNPSRSNAQSTSGEACNLSGYAWSDTIGWISFSCQDDGSCATSNYGMSMDANGNLSGYAWSDNIGWISADPSDVSGCPSGSCAPQVAGGVASGWLKALSGGSAQSGGWDGWISLGGTGYGVTENNSGSFSGWAWGDTDVGWVSFSGVSCTPTSNNCLAPTPFLQNGQCVSACASGYIQQGNSCVFTSCPLGYTQGTDGNGNPICTFKSCPNGYSENGNGQCVLLIPQAPQGDIIAVPSIIKTGSTSQISWSAQSVSSCSVSGTNGDGSGWSCASQSSCAATSTAQSSAITAQTTYTLSCQGQNGSTFTRKAIVSIAPTFQEQ